MTTNPTCSRCGANVAPGASFCSRCGNDVSGEQGHVATQKMASVPAPADPQDEILAQLKKATLGEYEIYGELGRGGMATVYLAHDVALDRKVAIKLMAPALLASGQAMAERFKREARTAAALSHPHVIPIYAVRESPGLLFFVMKYIEGRSLDAVIKERGALPVRMVQVMLAQVAGALGYAHRRGVIHRDMKPANVMLDEDGWAVVTDFGIAKVADARGLTMTGVTIGTPSYMSPEQCGAKEITGASDQYSLGIVAYEMLTGRVPFEADSLMGIMWQHFNDPPPPVLERRPDCPADLAHAVTRMLAKAAGDRWPSMDEFVAALGQGALAPDTTTMHEIRAMAKGGRGSAVRASHHTPASPVPPSGMVSPDAPTIRSDAMPAVTQPPPRPATTKPGQREPTAPTHVPEKTAGAAEAAARSAPTAVSAAPAASAAPAPSKRPVALYAGIGLGAVALAVVAGLMLKGGGGESPATPGGGAEAPAAAAPVASVMLSDRATSISVGGEATLTAFSADAAGNPLADRAVAWRSLDTGIVTVAAGGIARGQVRGVRPGRAEVEATVEGKTVRAVVTVTTVGAPVAQVTVTPAQASVPAGDSVRLVAAAKAQDGTTLGDRPVTWTSSDSTVARVTRAGWVVTLREGAATLSATAETQRGQARVSVTAARVAQVVVEPTGVSLQQGGADTLRAEPRDSRGNPLTGRPVQWRSADARIAAVSPAGVVTARAVGRTTITATVGDRAISVPVSVNAVPVAAVELAPERVEVEAGSTASLTVTARDAERGVLRERAADWSSSNDEVARVSAAGIVTGVAAGEARITARIEGKEAVVTVRVRPATVASVAVNSPAVTLTEGQGTMLSASPRDAQGAPLPDRRVQWRSDNARVASVSAGGEVKALAAGTARITASSEEKSATVTITVNARQAPVAVMPPPTPMPPRDTAEPVITRPTPPDAAGLVATRLAAGGKHTCAIARAGIAICWGANERGQLGTAAGQSSTGPVRNPDIRGLTAIASGAQHTCGLREGGAAICWGANDKGQLGAATPGRQLSADAVTVAGGRTFTALTAGDRHTCGLAADGAAWCWGDNNADQLGTGSSGPTPAPVRGGKKFRVLAAGAKHTCGVGTDGVVLCWGDGFSGQLGRGTRETQREPVAVDLDAKVKATDVASGREHACAVAQNGRVWCWGGNRSGEVGDGSTSERLSPREAQTPRGMRFTSVVAGADFTCALAEGGEVYCWGGNRSGQLGDGSRTNRPTPVAVQASFPFAAIVAGEAHACGLPRGRLPVCWGANTQGQLGDGTVEPRAQPTPVSLDSLRRP